MDAMGRAVRASGRATIMLRTKVPAGTGRHVVLPILLVLTVLATACAVGSSGSEQEQVRVDHTLDQAQDPGREAVSTGDPTNLPSDPSESDESSREDDEPRHAELRTPVEATASESESVAPAEDEPSDVPVAASLSSECVVRGGEITLTISTLPSIAAGYQAIYSDGSGGGPPPYGEGHGGNNGGTTDGDGHYVDTWRVSNTAPLGPAEVEAVVAHGGAFGKARASFEVVDALSGDCS